MPARIVEAIGDRMLHAPLPHVAERHRRAAGGSRSSPLSAGGMFAELGHLSDSSDAVRLN
jgi:hypothetical protein